MTDESADAYRLVGCFFHTENHLAEDTGKTFIWDDYGYA